MIALGVVACDTPTGSGSRTPAATSDAAAATQVRPSATPAASEATVDRAMQAASAMNKSITSHARLRARLQRDVAATALELGMIDAALRYADSVEDWRRGEVLAMAAQRLARSGYTARAEATLQKALPFVPTIDGWMQERLCTEIGLAYALLGRPEEARRFAARAPAELTGQVEACLTTVLPPEEIDRQCDAFDRAIATGSLDIVRSGVDGHFAAWDRVRGDAARRARCEQAIRAALDRLPLDLRVSMRLRLAAALDAAGRAEDARKDLDDADRLFQTLSLSPEVSGPLARDLAKAFVRVERRERALQLLSALVATYERNPAAIVDMERAEFLCPLAEGLLAAGDRDAAMRVWTLAIEAGALNPNARPRAEDLCRTGLSMARCGVEPTSAMNARMAEIQAGLKDPW